MQEGVNLGLGLNPRLAAAPAGRDAKLIVSKGCYNLLVAGMGAPPVRAQRAGRRVLSRGPATAARVTSPRTSESNSSFQGVHGGKAVFVRGKPRRIGCFALEAPNLLRARPPPRKTS